MPPVVIDVHNADDLRDVIHRAVQALAEGELVAFPTETVYGLAASALDADAVTCLVELKGRGPNHPLALAVKSADDALDYVPDISHVGRRLARRCWPGPVTLVLGDNHPDSLLRQLPEKVQKCVVPANTLGLRVPAHRLILGVLQLMAGPLVLTSANRTEEPDAVTAQQVIDQLGDGVQLVLDDGTSQFGQPSSVVQVEKNRLRMLREGVVSASTLSRLTNFMVLLVCTGNTCRSPMAEVLLKKQLADRLQCELDELQDQGVDVLSAGIAAAAGGRPSSGAVTVMQEKGLDLSEHFSQPVTARLVQHADLILAMTRSQRDALISHCPEAASRTHVLSTEEQDVSDPVGGSVDVYRECADQIYGNLLNRLESFNLDELIGSVDVGGL
ncbi:MAG: threonylcarbamoyl-AMP synthase [Planctomycetaceae bacterium]|nr:threonylcarbamoyl-AMP synthase [Planctomycetaceae bacterium]